MIEMVLLDVLEVATAEVIEVHRVVDPLLNDIGLRKSSQQHRQAEYGKQKTRGSGHSKQRQQVSYLAVDVLSITGA
jgi:hypothetical protein